MARYANGDTESGRNRVDVLAVVDYHSLADKVAVAARCETADHTPMTPAAMRRLACDAGIIPVVLGGPTVDLGIRRRTITTAQRNALIVRDGGCVFPGCDRPPSWCDGHHVIHWLNHGPSELWNLTLLCSAHHRPVHEGGWQLTHADRRTPATDRLVFTDPTGRRMPPDPPAARHRRQQAHQAPVPDPTAGAHNRTLTDRPQIIQRC